MGSRCVCVVMPHSLPCLPRFSCCCCWLSLRFCCHCHRRLLLLVGEINYVANAKCSALCRQGADWQQQRVQREREGERRYRRTAFGFYLAYWLAFAVSSSSSSSLLRLGLRLVSGYVCDSNSDSDSKSGVGVGHISGTTCRKNKPADKVTSLGWRCLHSLITAPSE